MRVQCTRQRCQAAPRRCSRTAFTRGSTSSAAADSARTWPLPHRAMSVEIEACRDGHPCSYGVTHGLVMSVYVASLPDSKVAFRVVHGLTGHVTVEHEHYPVELASLVHYSHV